MSLLLLFPFVIVPPPVAAQANIATCNDVIRVAMLRMKMLSAGEQPSAEEAADGMLALQSLYDQWSTGGMFGRLNDVSVTSAYTAQEWDRIQNPTAATITLPTLITLNQSYPSYWPQYGVYGYSTDVTPRPPYDLSQVEVIAPVGSARLIWDAHAGGWMPLNYLALTDAAPLAGRSLSGLASSLALMWADDFGATPGPATQRAATLFEFSIAARYGSARRAAMQDYY